MVAVKNSTKRSVARSPAAAAMTAGTTSAALRGVRCGRQEED
jgi:hypothetical protein